jgi:hypothetical protein
MLGTSRPLPQGTRMPAAGRTGIEVDGLGIPLLMMAQYL